MAKLTESEQRAIIAARYSKALPASSDLDAQRQSALNAYYGDPLGNEMDGRSQVVSKDIMDVIEWIMPSMMRVFCTQQAVQFDPVGQEDEEQAKQETGYVNHVLWKKNLGFMTIYNWAKDGLMQKNGYVKYWWQDEEKLVFENFTGLTDEQLVAVLDAKGQEGEVEIVGARQEDAGTYAIKLKIKKAYGCAKVVGVPPEEIVVSANCRSAVEDANFVGHKRQNVTRSELIEEGYDRKLVERLTSYDFSKDLDAQAARDTVNESASDNDDGNSDPSMQELELLECWTYVDADDDGIAELRHYLLAGNEVLENEEDVEIPFKSWTPVPIPHRHSGLSIYDKLEDLYRIKTALQRGLLDNVYFTNAPRSVYDKNTIELESLQINRPGGHVANDGPVVGAIMPMPVQPMAAAILPVVDYFDSVKQGRVGVGQMTQGIDADVLAQTTKGAFQDARSDANQLIEAIARIFAETGYSSLFRSLHGLLMRHQDWPEKFKLRNDWVETNPADWNSRTDLTVSVGLGNASKEEIRANLNVMAQAQMAAKEMPGLIQPDNVYSLFRRFQTELGFENENFATDPNSDKYKQFMQSQGQQQDPYVQGKQIEAQAKLQASTQENMADAQFRQVELAQERDLAITEMELKYHTDLAKAGIGAEVAIHGAKIKASQGGGAAAGKPAPSGSV